MQHEMIPSNLPLKNVPMRTFVTNLRCTPFNLQPLISFNFEPLTFNL